MAKKIVRDIQKQRPETLFLNQKKADIQDDQNRQQNQHNANNAIVAEASMVRDLASKKNHEESSQSAQKYFYRVIEEGKQKPVDRLGEVVRLVTAGLVILFLINLSNIYHRGLMLKDNVVASATNGYGDLIKAGKSAQGAAFTDAENSFLKAEKSFQQAQAEISIFTGEKAGFILQGKSSDSIRLVLEAGQKIAQAGQLFAKGIQNLQDFPTLFLKQITASGPSENSENSANQSPSLTEKLKSDFESLRLAITYLHQAADNLDSIDVRLLPSPYQDKFESLKTTLKSLNATLEKASERIPVILKLLGDRYPHRFLILLQNDTESRPTGGFIGSYMLVDTNDGYVTTTKFNDIYELDGQMHEDVLPMPEDIARISKNWRMRDSNYSPDFAISAEKAAWFLQKEKGPSVDTVIAINQHAIAPFLDITGPIALDGLKATIDKNNYLPIISYIVESKLTGKDDPKKILGDFIAEFQKKLAASHDWANILKHILTALQEKDIMLYSRDEEIEQFFTDIGAAGKISQQAQNQDYLNIITTSIGGNKTDFYIEQNAIHTTDIAEDGTIIDELVLSRTHHWGVEALKNLRTMLNPFGFTDLPNDIKNILGAGINKSIIKVYVPSGAVLDNAAGIDLKNVATRNDEALQKTYFMFEMDTAPSETNTVKLVYHLANKLDVTIADTYRFKAEKQAGMTETNLQKVMAHGSAINFYAHDPSSLHEDDLGQLTITQKNKKTLNLAVLVGKR